MTELLNSGLTPVLTKPDSRPISKSRSKKFGFMAKDLRQAPEHDADHGETDEGGDGSGVTLEVSGEAATAADPGESSFDDPAFGQDLEADAVSIA